MKKLMILTAAALAFSMTPVLADHHGDGKEKGEKYQKHDIDGDGVISKSEFLQGAEERFGKMDADGNGEISKEEAQAAHAAKKAERKERMKDRKKKRMEKSEKPAGEAE